MVKTLGKKILQQLVTLAVIVLILFAAYLSIGRQFIPAVSGYKSQFEDWLLATTGVPVSIDSLTGRFVGFNPVLEVSGLRLLVPVEPDPTSGLEAEPEIALEFAHATLILDVGRSLLLRRWTLENFVVEDMEATAVQGENGEWQLRGISTAGPGLGLNDIYRTLLRVSRLELRNMAVTFLAANGSSTNVVNSLAVIQNRGNEHFFHINANRAGDREQLILSMEVTGDELQEANGRVHVRVPVADYTELLRGTALAGMQLDAFSGGGNFWLSLADGQVTDVTLIGNANNLTLVPESGDYVNFERLSASVLWSRERDSANWALTVNRLDFSFNQQQWPVSDFHISSTADTALSIRAPRLDIGMAMELARYLGLLEEPLQEQLDVYQFRGQLANLALQVLYAQDSGERLELSTNLQDVAVNSVRNSPTMSGISGYLALDYDFQQQQLQGRAEVRSQNFQINIPSVFQDTWQYDQVAGALDFRVDTGSTRRVHLVSNVIHAQSDIVDGRVQFESDLETFADGRRRSAFTLLVGARDVQGSQKSPYLPSTPNLKSGLLKTMSWLEGALIDASVSEAGVIYRGSVLPGSMEAEKTFQSFYDFTGAHLRYQEAWPDLTEVSGRVLVRDKEADIAVGNAVSAGLVLSDASGTIRVRNGTELWLQVNGRTEGELQDGINFLAAAPLNLGLDQVMRDWEGQGQVDARLGLEIPLNAPAQAPKVDIAASLGQSQLVMPELQLQFDDLSGSVNYLTGRGLYDSHLQAEFFDSIAEISLQTVTGDNGSQDNSVKVSGSATTEVLAAWPRQSEFVRSLLGISSGNLSYMAELHLPDADRNTTLVIDSDLQDVLIDLPQPLGKSAEQRRPLHIELGIGEGAQPLRFSIGAELSGRLLLQDGGINEGVVHVGTIPGVANPWQPRGSKPGLEVRGNLDNFVVAEWLDLLESFTGEGSPAETLRDNLSLVQLDVGNLDVFDQLLPSINVEIQHLDNTDYWSIGLNSEAVAGSVLIPFDGDEYIEAYLAYLHLPGDEPSAEEIAATVEVDEEAQPVERVDPLAMMDPRRFPRLKFHTGSFRIGTRDYGLGQFTLDPTDDGAQFTGLVGNFRGLQVGMYGDAAPVIRWRYDGLRHHSYVTGVLTARDIADVLRNNGFAESLESDNARFDTDLDWPGSPAFFTSAGLSGHVSLNIEDGRFLQGSGGSGALKLISILNFDAIMRRARFSDDLLRRGLAYDEITGDFTLQNGIVTINDRLVISGPSSVYQISGQLDLVQQTINGEMYLTLPVSDNIPWLGLLTANIPLAIGAYLFDRIFGDQVDNLTSAQYTLQGPWEGLEPQFKQAFGAPSASAPAQPVL